VTLVLSTLNKSSGLSDERLFSRDSDKGISLAALAAGGVVEVIGHELVDSEGFTSNGRLIAGKDCVSVLGLGAFTELILLVLNLVGDAQIISADDFFEGLELVRCGVVADQCRVSRDASAFLDDDLWRWLVMTAVAAMESGTYNVTGNELTCENVVLLAITDNIGPHGNITTQTLDDVLSLTFLVPTDNSVKHQDTDDDTKVDPITKTSSEEDSQFHN